MTKKCILIFLLILSTIILKTNFFGLLSLNNGHYQYDSEDLAK